MAVSSLSNMLERRAPKSQEDLKLKTNATNVERLDTGLTNAEKKVPEMLKDVKRNATIAEKLAISRKTALILDTQEEDLHLGPAPALDQADLILETEDEEEAHPADPDQEAVTDLTPEINIRRITRERATRSIEAPTRREVEAEAQAVEARVIIVPEIEKIMKKTVTRAEVEVEANKIVESTTRQRFMNCKRV